MVLSDYQDHCNGHRPHRSRQQLPPSATEQPAIVHDLDDRSLLRTKVFEPHTVRSRAVSAAFVAAATAFAPFGLGLNQRRFCSTLYACRASASTSPVRSRRPRALLRYCGSACSRGLERGEGERGSSQGRVRVQPVRLHQLQELRAGPLDAGLKRCSDVGGDGGNVVRVVQGRRPGRGDQCGLHRQGLGPVPVAARLAQVGSALVGGDQRGTAA